ncbi:hypothetical protein GCM10028801_19580 [Nocardioides maradonensis]
MERDAPPRVSVVIPTKDRPALLLRAVDSVLAQDFAEDLEVIVVFDGGLPRFALPAGRPQRTVRTLTNQRRPGLAGSRNTGILAARGDLVAFCDDDDSWRPEKLSAQVEALTRAGGDFATTAMTVTYQGRRSIRLAGLSAVNHTMLLRSRMAMLHSSSFLVDRAALLGRIGLVDERLPHSMAEDWDLLLRASRGRDIVHVDRPLVEVSWSSSSYFVEQWQVRNDAQLWLLQHHPEMGRDRRAAALSYGKLAFGCAALGRRAEALRWAARAVRCRPVEPRAYLALAVASGVVSWRQVVHALKRRGHGV